MTRDYGLVGRIAVATPQANPTVEAEFQILLPRTASLHITRLQSSAPSSSERLIAYLAHVDAALRSFDSFRPDAIGFACTGSSYLLGRAREEAIIAEVAARGLGAVDLATAAIRWKLEQLGARRIALLSPYPPALVAAAQVYWRDSGLTMMRTAVVGGCAADTRDIYALQSADAAAALHQLDLSGLDAILLSGTGLPSLPVIAAWRGKPPLVSSNLCLAERLMARVGLAEGVAGWQARLAEAQGARPDAPA